jgi:hypothetical protein
MSRWQEMQPMGDEAAAPPASSSDAKIANQRRLIESSLFAGGPANYVNRVYLLFSGWLLTVFALFGSLVWSNTFFNFVPTHAFTDFSTIWYLPLVLQGPAATVLHLTRHKRSLRWLVFLVGFTILCLVIAIIQFASAMYGAVAIYALTIYTGGNGAYQVGIFLAVFVGLGILLVEIFHLIVAIFLATPPPSSLRPRRM